jgi:hypothetical protein
MLIEAHLVEPREHLQVPVPESYRGERRDNEDPSIHITTQPAYFTEGEIELVEAYVLKLPYSQSVTRTGAVLVGNDPLLTASAQQLDEIEKTAGVGSSKILDDGTDRPLLDRALMLRENGFSGQVPERPVELPVEQITSKSQPRGSNKAVELTA